METRVSSKGQVVLPIPIRRKLGLRTGDPLDASVEGGRIVLTPRQAGLRKPKILIDPITGFPVLSAGPDAPRLTSEQVEEILDVNALVALGFLEHEFHERFAS